MPAPQEVEDDDDELSDDEDDDEVPDLDDEGGECALEQRCIVSSKGGLPEEEARWQGDLVRRNSTQRRAGQLGQQRPALSLQPRTPRGLDGAARPRSAWLKSAAAAAPAQRRLAAALCAGRLLVRTQHLDGLAAARTNARRRTCSGQLAVPARQPAGGAVSAGRRRLLWPAVVTTALWRSGGHAACLSMGGHSGILNSRQGSCSHLWLPSSTRSRGT